ncbi:MAG: hypothetical protein ACI4RG_10675, partial [Huintestinicola sp.]
KVMFTKIKKILVIFAAAVIAAVCVFGVWYLIQPRTLIDTDTLQIVREGAKMTVYDLAGNEQYNFKSVRVKRSDGEAEPYTAINTDTISIDILPHAVLRITDKTADKVYIIQKGFNR